VRVFIFVEDDLKIEIPFLYVFTSVQGVLNVEKLPVHCFILYRVF